MSLQRKNIVHTHTLSFISKGLKIIFSKLFDFLNWPHDFCFFFYESVFYFLFFGILGSELQMIINDGSSEVNASSSDFWVMVAALKVTLIFIISCLFFPMYGLFFYHAKFSLRYYIGVHG